MNNTGFFDWISAHEKVMMDTAVVGTAVSGLSIWATYEVMAQNFDYADAGSMTAITCCGSPLFALGGGYVATRQLRNMAWQRPSLAAILARLRLLQQQPEAEPETTEFDMSDWLDVAGGIHRARYPIFPLGRNLETRGKVALDLRTNPHLLVTGRTHSGKTKSVLKPLIAMAAASGQFSVIILDESGRSFRAVSNHANVHLVKYTSETLPDICESIAAEVERRDKWLASQPDYPEELADVRADRRPPRLLIVIDELANAIGLLLEQNRRNAGRVTSALIRISQKGAAMGVHLAVVAQRPDHTQISTTLRGQLSGITFKMRDSTDARLAQAPGADSLQPGQAIFSHQTGYTQMQMWYPSNTELQQIMTAEEAKEWPKPTWLYGYETAVERAETPVTVNGRHGWDLGTNDVTQTGNGHRDGVTVTATPALTQLPKIHELQGEILADERPSQFDYMTVGQMKLATLALLSGWSLSATAQAVFGHKNGRYVDRIKAVQTLLETTLEAAN